MDFLKAQLDRIQQQLAGLNATQKMLTAALAAIMVITVIWWGKYASEAEMVPLLNQSLSAAELGRIQSHLELKQAHFSVASDRIMVPADQRLALLADLTYSRSLPHETRSGIDDILKQMNPFNSESKDAKLWNEAKQGVLSQIIGHMPGVVQADVVIDTSNARHIGADVEPTATANVLVEDSQKDPQQLVDAAAALLAGSQSGLHYNHITVIVNGQVQHVRDPVNDSFSGGAEQLALKKRYEDEQQNFIKRQYYFITGLSVAVAVKVNTTELQTEKQEYDAKGTVQKEVKSNETNEETTGGSQPAAGESGTVPNTGLNITPGAGATQQSQTHTQTETQFQNFVPSVHTLSKTMPGAPTYISAALHVPYGYFVNEYKSLNPGGSEPTNQQLQPLIANRLNAMRQSVANLLDISSIDKVTADTYFDSVPDMGARLAMVAKPSPVTAMVGGHAREIAMGALALMSLFMASMMVRKGAPAPVPAAPAPAQPTTPPILTAGEALAGEAGSGDALLDGMELNEEAIKAQQMVDQVSTMVRENPDAAASLVKRWLNRS